jgi:uncharacterized membrane protein
MANYRMLDDSEYDILFNKHEAGEKAEKLREAAFKRACENRDFEISNFWKRALYFGGFIAIIFNGYVNTVVVKNADTTKKTYLDLLLIVLGIIFSVAWLLAIKGSKQWQENWEQHINKLEDEITGPLYKTIYCEGKRLYSVSKICNMLAWIIIIVWALLLFKYLYKNFGALKCSLSICETIIFVILPIIVVAVAIVLFHIKCQTKKGKLYKQYKQDEEKKQPMKKNKKENAGKFYQKLLR